MKKSKKIYVVNPYTSTPEAFTSAKKAVARAFEAAESYVSSQYKPGVFLIGGDTNLCEPFGTSMSSEKETARFLRNREGYEEYTKFDICKENGPITETGITIEVLLLR